jgi:Holliday junction resolvase RusA-like endonuclease
VPKFGDCRKLRYHVRINVMLGKGQRLDIDNGLKVCLDALKDCGAIHSDAAVTALSVSMGRDAENPRTEIEVEAL